MFRCQFRRGYRAGGGGRGGGARDAAAARQVLLERAEEVMRERARKGRLQRRQLEYRAETGDVDALRKLLGSKDDIIAFAKSDIGRKKKNRTKKVGLGTGGTSRTTIF